MTLNLVAYRSPAGEWWVWVWDAVSAAEVRSAVWATPGLSYEECRWVREQMVAQDGMDE